MQKTLIGYKYTWPTENIEIEANRLKEKRDCLTGEIIIKKNSKHLHQANFNFSSTRAKTDLVKILSSKCEEEESIKWDVIIECLRIETIKNFRTGEPVLVFCGEEVEKPKFLLYPLIQEKQLMLIFGEGGSGKTTFALLLAACLQEEVQIKNIILNKPCKNILFLDYETDPNTMAYQYGNILRGLGLEGLKLHYRLCTLPIFDDADKIKEVLVDTGANVVIIDSAGLACGSDMKEAMTANRLALVLRSLDTTNILITHTSKDNTTKKTPYGSVYFYNNARNVWELRQAPGQSENKLCIALNHRKSNTMRLNKPLGFEFTYHSNLTEIATFEPKEHEVFKNEFTWEDRIYDYLLQHGKTTANAIAEEFDERPEKMRSILSRMKKKARVIKIEDEWGIYNKWA